MSRYPGRILSSTAPTVNATSAKGIWTLDEALRYKNAGQWPVPTGGGDPYFGYNTLLLPGQGTNGSNNNTFLDSSTNNFTITRNGNTTQGTFTPFSHDAGYWGNYFDGSGDYLTYPNSAAIDFGTNDVTIEAWVYLLTSSGAQTITSAFATSGSGFTAWSFDITSSRFLNVTSYVSGTAQSVTATNNAIPANQWTHVAYTRSGGTSRLFVNGVSCSFSGAISQAINSGGYPGSIGSTRYAGYEGYLNGYISNVRIVKGTAVYTSDFTPSTTPLTAISGTSLLTCQSNRFVDNSTNAFAITSYDNTSIQTFQPFGTPTSAYSAATNGGSGYFDGSGDYLTGPTNTASSFNLTGDFTVECWAYFGSVSTAYAGLIGWSDGSGWNGWQLVNNAGTIYFEFLTGSGAAGTVNSSTAVKVSQWYHIAACRSGSTITLYLNGVSVGTSTYSSSQTSASSYLKIGTDRTSAAYSTGYISDARVVNGTAVYTGAFTPPTAPLTAITNTKLLLSYTNAGVIDNAVSNDLETSGTSAISTTQYKWGSSSIYFNPGETNPLIVPNNPMFNLSSGDFTIESWVYISSNRTYNYIISKGTSNAREWGFSVGPSDLRFYWSTNGSSTGDSAVTGSVTISTGTWVHAAVTRVGTTIKLFLNGNQVGSGTFTSMYSGTAPVYVGRFMDFTNISHDLSGYLSDLRITKGYPRYLYNFTAPTAAFPLFYQAAATPSSDPYFENVTMLLPGNGTNGAQNNTFLDSSTNALTITRNGNTTQGTFTPFAKDAGRWGNYFSGGTYLNVTNNTVLNLTGVSFTIEAWIYCTGLSGIYASWIAGKRALSGPYPVSWYLGLNSSRQVFLADNSTAATSADLVPLNQWTHVAAVCTGSSVQMYVNGVKSGAAVNLSISEVSTDLTIGNYPIDNPVFNGYISNLRLIKGQALTTGSFTPPTGPVSNAAVGWTGSNVAGSITGTVSLVTCQSNRFVDNSGNNLTIAVSGSPSVQTFSPFSNTAAYSTSVVGGSGYFDGTGDYLSLANNTAFDPGAGDWCAECWIYPTYSSGADKIVMGNFTVSSYPSNCPGWDFNAATYNTISFRWGYPTYTDTGAFATQPYAWNHIAVSRSGGRLSFYVNGVRVYTTTSNTSISASSLSMNIGASNYNNVYNGNISGVRIVKGSTPYDPTSSTLTVPTAPPTAITNTTLLANFTNGGIIDNAMSNDLETVGGASISTTQSKFGGSSMYFDGNGDYLITNCASGSLRAYGTGDWTIEFWLYLNTTAGTQLIYDQRKNASTDLAPMIMYYSGALCFYTNANIQITGSSLSTGTWYHIALCKFSGSTKLFVNGIQSGSTYTDSLNYVGFADRPVVGAEGVSVGANPLNGYIDDLRVTKGIARYVQNFTPPTQAFPLL